MKAFGRFLVFASCLLVGAALAWQKRRRLEREREISRLMRHCEQQIRTSLCPRTRLFCEFSSPVLSQCGLLPALQRGEDPHKVCLSHGEALGLEKQARECLCRFFSSLGKLGYEEQLRHCALCLEEWEALVAQHEKRDGDAIRLNLTLGAAAGAFALILLL